jgi:hypothetical protein
LLPSIRSQEQAPQGSPNHSLLTGSNTCSLRTRSQGKWSRFSSH